MVLIVVKFPKVLLELIIGHPLMIDPLLIEQKYVAMMPISSAVFKWILTKSGIDDLSRSENNLAKSEFNKNQKQPGVPNFVISVFYMDFSLV